MLRLIALRLLESFFHHRWRYLLPLVLMVAASGVFLLVAPPQFEARGAVYVQRETLLGTLSAVRDGGSYQWSSPSQMTTTEVNALLRTDTFARSIIANTKWADRLQQGPREIDQVLIDFRRAVRVQAEGNNTVFFIGSDDNPELAQQLAGQTMRAYVDWRATSDRKDSEVAQAFFADLMKRYNAELEEKRQELRDYLIANPDPVRGDRPSEQKVEINRLEAAVDEATKRVNETREKEENARLSLSKATSDALQNYRVIDEPVLPNQPPSLLRRVAFTVGGFLAGGVLLSLLWMLFNIFVERRLVFPIDAHYGINAPVLALIPYRPITIPSTNPELAGGRVSNRLIDEKVVSGA
ncbi:MAG: hypothetical protein MUD01_00105 [Chloroflexaceae bacterium]|jgi:uncharacterized protein involved in exopolysaccharide biosynthesis|nr:hypothetical protein [Chloroflexaceae bacterium]